MNFGAVLGASLRSGCALPPRRTENRGLPHQPAEAPLIKAETVSRRSQPPLGDCHCSRPFITLFQHRMKVVFPPAEVDRALILHTVLDQLLGQPTRLPTCYG